MKQHDSEWRSAIADVLRLSGPDTDAARAQRSWLPPHALVSRSLSRSYWLTRGARGISWHRSGRVSQEPTR